MKIVSKLPYIAALVALSLSAYTPIAQSESVRIPLGQQGDQWDVKRPRTGMTKSNVITAYGEPSSKSGPVGDPAIYTWSYPQFKVFFEHDKVIHSVVLRK